MKFIGRIKQWFRRDKEAEKPTEIDKIINKVRAQAVLNIIKGSRSDEMLKHQNYRHPLGQVKESACPRCGEPITNVYPPYKGGIININQSQVGSPVYMHRNCYILWKSENKQAVEELLMSIGRGR